jgi:hypothetical protein
MRRFVRMSVGMLVLALFAGSVAAYAQGVFKIPFKFEAGGKKYPAGDYVVAPKGEGQLALRPAAGGAEALVNVLNRIDQPTPPVAEIRLVFNMVGNFEPSYSEYVTDYVLAELWLPGEKGYLTHVLKGAHQTKAIKGEPAKK